MNSSRYFYLLPLADFFIMRAYACQEVTIPWRWFSAPTSPSTPVQLFWHHDLSFLNHGLQHNHTQKLCLQLRILTIIRLWIMRGAYSQSEKIRLFFQNQARAQLNTHYLKQLWLFPCDSCEVPRRCFTRNTPLSHASDLARMPKARFLLFRAFMI